MTSEQRTAIAGYIEKVGREWRSGQATEHTYRPMLKALVETLLPRVTAVNEPKHIACGAPDYLLRRGADILGFIEANGLESVKWQTLALQEPYYFFVPKDFGLQEEYEKGFKIDELMPVCNMGIVTDRDSLFVDTERQAVRLRCEVLLSGKYDDKFRDEYRVYDSSSYPLTERIKNRSFDEEHIKRFLYRPFDLQWVYYDPAVISRPCYGIMKNMLQDNLALLCVRNTRRGSPCNYFVSDTVLDKTAVSSFDNCRFFPLYLYETSEANLIQVKGKVERRPNFDEAIYAKICAAVNDAPCLQASANTVRDNRLAYYRGHELGKTWYDVADPRELLTMKPIAVETVDPNADRHTAKEVFRKMPPVRNAADGRVVRFTVRAAKKLIFHKEISVFGLCASFDRLFAGSIHAWSETAADIPDHRPHPNIDAYHHYIAKAAVGGEMFYVRFTVCEDVRARDGNEFHGTMVTRVVVYSAKDAILSNTWETQGEALAPQKATGTGRSFRSHTHGESPVPFVDNKIALFLSAVNGGAENFRPTPEDVFNYIYGVLHTPSYRERYREFLKIDFPRIPYPKDAAEFRRVAAVGEKLVKVHLLKDEAVTNPFANPYAKFAGAGDGIVEKVVFQVCTSGEDAASPLGRVYVNGGQWFEPVPEEAWNFSIGGYQPAQKWLKDRKGRTLTTDDQQHYRAIVAALVKTSALMGELESGMRN